MHVRNKLDTVSNESTTLLYCYICFSGIITYANLHIPVLPEDTARCPITIQKRWRTYNATVTHGEAKIVQRDGSNVSLTIPEGSDGFYITRIHTDLSDYQDLIPSNECFVSPVVQVEELKGRTHTILIPHCLQDKSLWQSIQVRRCETKMNRVIEELKQGKSQNGYFMVYEKYIIVYTSCSGLFVCTSWEHSCHSSVSVVCLARSQNFEEAAKTTVKLKTFGCSSLYRILDFRKVSRRFVFIKPEFFYSTQFRPKRAYHVTQNISTCALPEI